MTGVRVATTVQAALRERGIDVTIKSVSNAQLFLPKTGTLAVSEKSAGTVTLYPTGRGAPGRVNAGRPPGW